MAEEPSLSYYLPIAGGRIIGFIPSPRLLLLCEMPSVSSRIWTRVAVYISYDDNDYTSVQAWNIHFEMLPHWIALKQILFFEIKMIFFWYETNFKPYLVYLYVKKTKTKNSWKKVFSFLSKQKAKKKQTNPPPQKNFNPPSTKK